MQALTRLAPENDALILAAAMYPFDPEQGMNDLFSGANFRNLSRARESLEEWDEDGSRLDRFEASYGAACVAAGVDCSEIM